MSLIMHMNALAISVGVQQYSARLLLGVTGVTRASTPTAPMHTPDFRNACADTLRIQIGYAALQLPPPTHTDRSRGRVLSCSPIGREDG